MSVHALIKHHKMHYCRNIHSCVKSYVYVLFGHYAEMLEGKISDIEI